VVTAVSKHSRESIDSCVNYALVKFVPCCHAQDIDVGSIFTSSIKFFLSLEYLLYSQVKTAGSI